MNPIVLDTGIAITCNISLVISRAGHYIGAVLKKVPRPGGEPGIFFGFRLFSLSKAAP